MRKAMSTEIQAWLKHHAVQAALRSNYAEKSIMEMRWILRFKESGAAKARLVIIGYQDPRIGSEVRTEAPAISRRGRALSFTKVSQRGVRLRKGDVKNAFLQCHVVNEAQELIADPVPELVEHLGLSPDEVVVLTKFCYGPIDAPLETWKVMRHSVLSRG